MVNNYHFKSDRLKSAELSEKDAEILFQIYSDQEAMKYRGNKPMTSLAEAYRMIADRSLTRNQSSIKRLGIWRLSDDQLIGTLLITNNTENKKVCEIGFSFGKEYWGKGFGQETILMIEEKFKIDAEVEELKAWCIRENKASVHIFQKAGFTEIVQDEHPQSILFEKKLG